LAAAGGGPAETGLLISVLTGLVYTEVSTIFSFLQLYWFDGYGMDGCGALSNPSLAYKPEPWHGLSYEGAT